MEKKRVYERPALRMVRLDVKTAVLSVCNMSATSDPAPLCTVSPGTCYDA